MCAFWIAFIHRLWYCKRFCRKRKDQRFQAYAEEQELHRWFNWLGKEWLVPRDLSAMFHKFTFKLVCYQMPKHYHKWAKVSIIPSPERRGRVRTASFLWRLPLPAHYQAGVWHYVLEEFPSIPNLRGHGWCHEDGKLTICWMTGLPAPDIITEFVSCICTSVCKLPNCQDLDCNNWHENDSMVQNFDSEDSSDDAD